MWLRFSKSLLAESSYCVAVYKFEKKWQKLAYNFY